MFTIGVGKRGSVAYFAKLDITITKTLVIRKIRLGFKTNVSKVCDTNTHIRLTNCTVSFIMKYDSIKNENYDFFTGKEEKKEKHMKNSSKNNAPPDETCKSLKHARI